jgi:hypothetical protein
LAGQAWGKGRKNRIFEVISIIWVTFFAAFYPILTLTNRLFLNLALGGKLKVGG